MNKGYLILVWDAYGSGTVMVNPRLHVEGEDCYGNPKNKFYLSGKPMTNIEIAEKHKLSENYKYWKIVHD